MDIQYDIQKYIGTHIIERGWCWEYDGILYPRWGLRYIIGYILTKDVLDRNKRYFDMSNGLSIFDTDEDIIVPVFTGNKKTDNIISSLLMFGVLPENVNQDLLISGWNNYVGFAETGAKNKISKGDLFPEVSMKNHITFFSRTDMDMVDEFMMNLENEFGCDMGMELVGSLGRGKKDGHDIDFICDIANMEDIIDYMSNYTKVAKGYSWAVVLNDKVVRIDIAFYKPNYYVTFKSHYMGPVDKNIKLRRKAIKKGCKLSQYGLVCNGENIVFDDESSLIKFLE